MIFDDAPGDSVASGSKAGDPGLGLFDDEAEYAAQTVTRTAPRGATPGISPAPAPGPAAPGPTASGSRVEPVPHPSDRLPIELDPRGRRAAKAAGREAAKADRGTSEPRSARGHRSNAGSLAADIRRGVGLGTLAVAGLLSIAIVLGSGYYWYTFRSLSTGIKRVDAIPMPGNAGSGAPVTDIDGVDQNILLVGTDDRSTATPEEMRALGTTPDGGSLNTDTIMIMHVPADGRSASIISIPRDTYVAIPGFGMGKINSAYPLGLHSRPGGNDQNAGSQLVVSTVRNLTGLTFDHFVQVDLISFYRISNAIGGVPVCLNAAMGPSHAYGRVGPGLDSGYEPSGKYVYSYSGIDLKAGVNSIKGTQALAFVRQRHGLPQGDFDRAKRQQYFLTAAFKEMSRAGFLLNPSKLNDLIGAIKGSMVMDQDLNPLKLAQQFINLSAGSIKTQTIPTLGFGSHNGQSTVEVDPSAVKTFVKAVINAQINDPTRPSPSPSPASSPVGSGIAVEVLNAGASNGAAGRNATALNAAGFKANVGTTTPPTASKTLIKYPDSMLSDAQVLQKDVPGAALQISSAVTKITLVLGGDGVSATGVVAQNSGPTSSATASKAPTIIAPNAAATGGCIN